MPWSLATRTNVVWLLGGLHSLNEKQTVLFSVVNHFLSIQWITKHLNCINNSRRNMLSALQLVKKYKRHSYLNVACNYMHHAWTKMKAKNDQLLKKFTSIFALKLNASCVVLVSFPARHISMINFRKGWK